VALGKAGKRASVTSVSLPKASNSLLAAFRGIAAGVPVCDLGAHSARTKCLACESKSVSEAAFAA
jgi:hypothetical protein